MDIQAYIESGVIESYVLGLASAEEIAEIELLKKEYPQVNEAIENFSASIEQFAFENTVTPPADVKARLMSMFENEFAPAETQDGIVKPAPVISLNKTFRIWQYVAAASILLFIVSAALNIYFYNNYETANNKYQALLVQRNSLQASNDVYRTKLYNTSESLQLLLNPDMKLVKMPGIAGKENNFAAVLWNSKTQEVYYMPGGLAPVPDDKQYQLWAIVDGKPVDAGLIGNCDGLCKMKNIHNASAFAITLEKKGGSPVPTMSAMYVMGGV